MRLDNVCCETINRCLYLNPVRSCVASRLAEARGLLDSAEDVDTDIDRLMCFNLIGRGTWTVRFRRGFRYRHRLLFFNYIGRGNFTWRCDVRGNIFL